MPDLHQAHKMLDQCDMMSLGDYYGVLHANLKNPKGYKKNSNSSVEVFYVVCQILKNTTKPVTKFALSMLSGRRLD